MNPALVFAKTDKGHEEVERRVYRLDFKHRSALIQIDGKHDAASLSARLPGDGLALIEELWRDGFIAPAGGEQWSAPGARAPATAPGAMEFDLAASQRKAARLIESVLGPGGDSLAIAIERTKSRDEFLKVALRTRDVIKEVGGQKRASDFWTQVSGEPPKPPTP